MNPVTETWASTIGLNVLSNVLTSLLYQAVPKKTDTSGLRRLQAALARDPGLLGLLQRSATSFAKQLSLGKTQSDRVRAFLVSPEVEHLLRQIFSLSLSGELDSEASATKMEFQHALAFHLGMPVGEIEELATNLYDALLAWCGRAIEVAAEAGLISAAFQLTARNQRVLRDEIRGIGRAIEFWRTSARVKIDEIEDYEKRYRRQVAQEHKYITPPDLDSAKRVAVEKLYVSSDFIDESEAEPKKLTYNDLLQVAHRAVILGNPGGGKSTFISKLCHDLSANYNDRLFAGRLLTPILVVLRDYAAQKKARGLSILQFIQQTATSDLQLPALDGVFDYLLSNGRVIVFFDGLDELLETSDRQRVRSDVELFAQYYPSVSIFVTSRVVGYEQAPLDSEQFKSFRLAPFNEAQVGSYVKKWFDTNTVLSPAQQRVKVQAFLSESELVPDLRSNPLMLSLICNIYRIEGYIPRNRPEVYKKCAEMLFEKWDKRRGIIYQGTLAFETHVRPAMNQLAYWIYQDPRQQSGVSEESLIKEAAAYFEQYVFDDQERSRKAARDFIQFCTGRAWVFTDTGTKAHGERLYQFTHRTFLEFFAAEHLVQTLRTPEDVAAQLHPHIALREWDIVAQLTYQLKGKAFRGDSDRLLELLLEAATKAQVDEQRFNFISFAARCLEFMIPGPRIRRLVAKAAIDETFEIVLRQERREQAYASTRGELMAALFSAAEENREDIAATLNAELEVRIQASHEPIRTLALELGAEPEVCLLARDRHPISDTTQAFWVELARAFVDKHRSVLVEGAAVDDRVGVDAVRIQLVTVADLVKWHGIGIIFRNLEYRFTNVFRSSIAQLLLRETFTSHLTPRKEWTLKSLDQLAPTMLTETRPWIADDTGDLLPWIRTGSDFLRHTPSKVTDGGLATSLDAKQRFAVFGLLAMLSEGTEMQELAALAKRRGNHLLDDFILICKIKVGKEGREKLPEILARLRFTDAQKQFAFDWARGRFRLYASPLLPTIPFEFGESVGQVGQADRET